MDLETLTLRLKATITEAIHQTVESADKEASNEQLESMAERFDGLIAEIASEIDKLPDLNAGQKRN